MTIHLTFNEKNKDTKKFRKLQFLIPSNIYLITQLLKTTLITVGFLCLLISFHGGSYQKVFFNMRAVEYTADDLKIYPTLHFDDEKTIESSKQYLNTAGEKIIAEKEELLKEAANNEHSYDDVESEAVTEEKSKISSLGDFLFTDAEKYVAADDILVGEKLKKYPKMWKLQGMHDHYFSENIHKRYVPHLAQSISKAWSLDELLKRFPYTPPKNGKSSMAYNTKSGQKDGLDLGPALYALAQDQELKKGKGFKRNFPRNLKIKSKYMALLDVSHPPFIPKSRFQPPTLWMGTSSSDTRLHSDCCDNFVQMISGTKRWFIAPPSDSRNLYPIVCEGKHQSLCWASVKYPSGPRSREMTVAEKAKLGKSNGIVIDLHAGEMLYLPAGWWHHIENLGPTIMVNFWTYGCENVGLALDQDPVRSDRPDFKRCPSVAQADASFLYAE